MDYLKQCTCVSVSAYCLCALCAQNTIVSDWEVLEPELLDGEADKGPWRNASDKCKVDMLKKVCRAGCYEHMARVAQWYRQHMEWHQVPFVKKGRLSAGRHECGWVRTGLQACGLVRAGLQACGLVRAGLQACGWVRAGLHECGWVRAGPHECGWVRAGLPECGWVEGRAA